jgi:hypothetical protein
MVKYKPNMKRYPLKNKKTAFCVWNVGGLISKSYNKIQDENFIKEIKDYDIVLLTETHLGYNSQINIENVKIFLTIILYKIWL